MDVLVKWLGHASFMVKAKEKTIYIDPYEGSYTEKADLILVTHSHHDHCDTTKINMIRKEDTTIYAPSDCVSMIGEKVKSLKPGDQAVVGSITVEAVQAYNYQRFRSPGVPYHPKGLGVGYLITVEGKALYHAGDTDFIPEMKRLRTKNLDLALLPSGGTYTMDTPEAVEAALAIKPKMVIPMHCWDTNPKEFQKAVETTSQIKVVTLKPGQHITLQ
ncbi:MAG: MBL fold metallo-hydrolase [Candidatus Bathyarchaeota archaeon]|nr:MAG: MBL fold metallo-hydrolase [Candidatus Bathyarchaeota archaeon]